MLSGSHEPNPHAGQPIQQEQLLSGEHRPWGNYLILADTPHYKCKQLQVLPGQRLSLQMHHHREEHWIITQGHGTVTLNDAQVKVKAGDTVHIHTEMKHRLENTGDTLLELVEIQLGDSFAEDDIVRFDDDYDRV
jgi:mannose-6-phosphate isomerase-like protein (cupin superfamily)